MCHRAGKQIATASESGCATGHPENASRNGETMCYSDTITNPDGTATAFCSCFWLQDHAKTPKRARTAIIGRLRNFPFLPDRDA